MMSKRKKEKSTFSHTLAKPSLAGEKKNTKKINWSKSDHKSPENNGDLIAMHLHAESARNSKKFALSNRLYTKIIQLAPDDIKALTGRATLFHNFGKYSLAIQDFNVAIDLKPQIAETYNNRGVTFLRLQKFKSALSDFSIAVSIKPKFSTAHCNRGHANQKLGNFEGALADYSTSISINNQSFDAIYNRANVLQLVGRFAEARDGYGDALKLRPNFAMALNNRGIVEKKLGNLERSLHNFNQAITAEPNYADALYNRGNLVKEMGLIDEALDDLNAAIRINPLNAFAFNSRGNILKQLLRPDDAIKDFDTALQLKPNLADAFNNRGIVNNELRKFEKAKADYERAISISPGLASTHRQLSALKQYTPSDPHTAQMLRLLKKRNLSREDKCHLLYALAKSSQDQQKYAEAFDYFERAGKLKKDIIKYDIAYDKTQFDWVKKTATSIARIEINQPSLSIKPIFIFGMPRSGTTLVEQIICSHPDVFGAGELTFWGNHGTKLIKGGFEITEQLILQLRKKYATYLKKICASQCFITDKTPNNFLFIALIKSAFPDAKLIHVHREPAATCWSNFTNYFASNSLGYSYELADIVEYYCLYEDLMRFWEDFYQSEIYTLNYETLTRDPTNQIKTMIQHTGLKWDDACLSPQDNTRPIKTASLGQVGKKIYQNSSRNWEKYKTLIGNKFDNLPRHHFPMR